MTTAAAAAAAAAPPPVKHPELAPAAVDDAPARQDRDFLLPLLAGLWLAALAVAAASLYWRKARQIARTKALLALTPRIDLAEGACAATGIALAGPSLAIRARLDPGHG